eukprot:7776443-Pyramimonas_sp.AAC.1
MHERTLAAHMPGTSISPDGNIVGPCNARAVVARVIPSLVTFRMRSPTYTHPPDDRAHSAQCLTMYTAHSPTNCALECARWLHFLQKSELPSMADLWPCLNSFASASSAAPVAPFGNTRGVSAL